METFKTRILAHSTQAIERLRPQPRAIIATVCITLLSVVTAYALVSNESPSSLPHFRTVTEELNAQAELILANSPEFLHEERIQRSDTVSTLISRLGITDPQASEFIRTSRETQVISRQLRPGKTVSAKTGPDGELLSLRFPLNGKDAFLQIERSSGGFQSREVNLALETQVIVKSGVIRSSLFAATDASGIPDSIAIQLAEIFSGDIDFYRDIRRGDHFLLAYESLTHQGQPVRSGKILAAEFTNGKKTHKAFWFEIEKCKGGYYTADGNNLRKAFLRSPLEFSRITSGFSGARLHPVLKVSRAHKGIDYAAPIGTRVRAVADASVEFAGWQGGYGNLVILRHQGVYSTAYGHLNSFGPGIRKGARVSQGDTIGFVGKTGLSTGPHLHYEFRINAKQVNPVSLALPASPPLPASMIPVFKKSTLPLISKLELARQIQIAAVK